MEVLNLHKAWRLMDGDKDLYRDLFGLIEKSLDERYSLLDKALADQSKDDLEMYGHQLKGALRNVAADKVCDLLFELEKCGVSGDFSRGKELMPLCRAGVTELLAEFRTRKWEAAFDGFSRAGSFEPK